MARARGNVEPSDDIMFFHRPLPSGSADALLYIEDQIEELLFSEETLSDVIYHFVENGDEALIAVARVKVLERKPLAQKAVWYRIPSAIELWLKAKASLPPGRLSLLLAAHGESAYLICADALQVRRVYKFAPGENLDRDVVVAIDKIREKYQPGEFPLTLYSQKAISDLLRRELRNRSIEAAPLPAGTLSPGENDLIEQWDFRLPGEVTAQQQNRQKFLILRAGIVSIVLVAAAWALLFGVSALLERLEQRSTVRWQGLRGSLREIGYLQKQTGQCISEIMLCQKLSEKRTNRALILQQISTTRPEQVTLEQLQIGERKKRFDKGAAVVTSEDLVVLKGYGSDGNRVTAWMELLQKGGVFSSVNLASMEKKGGSYHFTIECMLATR
jgi:Tfp pilus assembly protein PilN